MISKTILPFAVLGSAPYVGTTLAQSSSDTGGGVAAFLCFGYCCALIIFGVIPLIGLYKIFEKAGQPGWHALIPILSGAVVAHIVGRDWWWGVIPYLNLVPIFELAKAFGKSGGYGVGLILLPVVFMPMLGFGKDEFQMERRNPLF